MSSLKLPIEGMSCGGCVTSVTRALQAQGIDVVEVSLERKEAVLRGTSREQAAAIVEAAGFQVPAA